MRASDLHRRAICGTTIAEGGSRHFAAREICMDGNGGFRAHHKYMIAAIGVIAVLAFLYNLGIFDIWSVDQAAK
jgi:hypothetical protein